MWELRVQLCTDPETMPVEEATVEWDEDESPYLAVATLPATAQEVHSDARRVWVDERLSFNPWHCLAAHRPLGNIMRARFKAYAMSAKFRRAREGRQPVEPRFHRRDAGLRRCPGRADARGVAGREVECRQSSLGHDSNFGIDLHAKMQFDARVSSGFFSGSRSRVRHHPPFMNNHLKRSLVALAFTACATIVPTVRAQFTSGTISVDFNSDSGGAIIAPTQNAVLTPGTWNEVDAGANVAVNTSGIALNDNSGMLSKVMLAYTANGSYNVDPYLNTTERANSPNLGLLEDFILSNTAATPSTVTLSGLSANTSYNLYLYSAGNANGRQTAFTIGTTTKTATFADADTSFVNGDNFVSYLGVTSSSMGVITILMRPSPGKENFDGFQITPAAVPEPRSMALLGLGGMSALGFAGRRRQARG